jgi:D-alanyl-lipoteichoic acid acyltransferase DltB (MBOAT superfamily)
MSAGTITITEGRTEARRLSWAAVARFLSTVLQLGLVVLVIRQFEIEGSAFYRLSVLTLAGFAVHALLPMAYRMPFFLLLSITGTLLVMGPINGLWILGLGGFLLTLSHLPVRFSFRVGIVLAATLLLGLFRSNLLPSGIPGPIWPILASMFMFRLAIYLYDLTHGVEAGTPARVLSYFFMIPNVAFPLFPVVDYKTFVRNYYDDDAWRIYQRGLQWILRGVLHLIAYRFVYHYLTMDLAEVRTGPQVVQYIFSSFMLYLRVSGMYHLAVGILHLFGFRLPETNHFWLFCQSFTDLWRRMNIYFKDFMMKLVYYPSFFRLRKKGMRKAIGLSLVMVFFMTWALHAVQWFWLRSELLLTWQDGFFYVILGAFVIYQSLKEAKPGRKRALDTGHTRWSARRAVNALLTMGLLMIAWSFWTADSVDQWVAMFQGMTDWPLMGSLVVAGSLVLYLGLAGLPWRSPELVEKKDVPLLRPAMLTTGMLGGLLIAGHPIVYERLDTRGTDLVLALKENKLNRRDQAVLLRGYYEKVDNQSKLTSQVWELGDGMTEDVRITSTAAYRVRSDFLGGELVPLTHIVFKDADFFTNRWGMHDREYEQAKPEGTHRIALVGPSDVMGPGVLAPETFEALVELRLNEQHAGHRFQSYEILNFGVAAFTLPQQTVMIHERVLGFDPDLVIMTLHPVSDPPAMIRYLVSAVQRRVRIPDPELQSIIDRAGIDSTMSDAVAKRNIWPYFEEIMRWSVRHVATICRERGIPLGLLVVDAITESSPREQQLVRYADSLGLAIMDLRDTHRNHDARTLVLAENDRHPNKLGHRLLAEALYRRLLALGDTLGLGLDPAIQSSQSTQEGK